MDLIKSEIKDPNDSWLSERCILIFFFKLAANEVFLAFHYHTQQSITNEQKCGTECLMKA